MSFACLLAILALAAGSHYRVLKLVTLYLVCDAYRGFQEITEYCILLHTGNYPPYWAYWTMLCIMNERSIKTGNCRANGND